MKCKQYTTNKLKTCYMSYISFHPLNITIAFLYNMLHISIKKERRKERNTDRKKEKERKKSIKSHNHNIKSYNITKCSLSCFDNKRYILEDGITTLTYGHYKTKSKAKSDKADRVTKEEI